MELQDVPEDLNRFGQLGDIDAWTQYEEDLKSLLVQFHEPTTQQVLMILEAAKSSYLKPFMCAAYL